MPRANVGDVNRWLQKPAIAVLNQDPPVQNTWYTVLATTLDVLLLTITIRQINDEVAAKDVEVRLTIDGIVMTGVQVAADSTWYWAWLLHDQDNLQYNPTSINVADREGLAGLSALVEVRMTSVPGTNQELDGRVQYQQRVIT